LKIIKIHDSLYRVYNNDRCKDVWVIGKEIQLPKTEADALSPTETQAIEMEIF